MKKLVKGLLVASLMVGAVEAVSSVNKTFMATRPAGTHIAREGTTWHTQVNMPEANEGKFGGSFQTIGFYEQNLSSNEDAVGKYFGINDNNVLYVGNSSLGAVDVDNRHLMYDPQGVLADTEFTGTLNLKYQHKAAGGVIVYQQDLDEHYKGLYIKVRAPILWQDSGLKLDLTGSTSATSLSTASYAISDYFDGTLTGTEGAGHKLGVRYFGSMQEPLRYAKINGAHGRVGLADLDIMTGWSFSESESSHVGGNIAITIPTAPLPDGEFLGEQSYGKGHWAIGAGIDYEFMAWRGEDSSLRIDSAVDWRFHFKALEMRTLGLNDRPWGQYYMLGKVGNNVVTPAANVLTQKVFVRPGSHVDGRMGLAYRYKGFTFDLGVNTYAKQAEQITKQDIPDHWITAWGLMDNDYDPVADIANTDFGDRRQTIALTTASNLDNSALGWHDIDVKTAETPSYVTHKVYTGVGYAWNEWKTPLMLGVGGHFEVYTSQKALETWGAWAKLGLSF